MGNIYIALLIIFGLLWGGALFTGFVKGMRKGLESQPTVETNAQKLRERQERIVEEAEYQRKRMMEDYKQKMRDRDLMGF